MVRKGVKMANLVFKTEDGRRTGRPVSFVRATGKVSELGLIEELRVGCVTRGITLVQLERTTGNFTMEVAVGRTEKGIRTYGNGKQAGDVDAVKARMQQVFKEVTRNGQPLSEPHRE